MRITKLFPLLLGLTVFALEMPVCGAAEPEPTASASPEITLGWIGALTGDAAAIGVDSLAAVELAVKQANERNPSGAPKLRVIAEDDGYEVSRTLTAYEKLRSQVSSRVIFISTYGAIFALKQRPVTDDILLFDTLDCNDQIVQTSPHHLCLATRTESIADNFLTALRANTSKQPNKKVAILFEEEAWFRFTVDRLATALGSDLIQIPVTTRAGDYRSELMRVKQSKASHLILLGNDSMGRAVQQAHDMNLNLQLYSIAGIMSPGFQQLAGKNLEGTIVSHWELQPGEMRERFIADFQALHERKPTLEFVAAPSFDGASLVIDTIRSHTSPLTAQALRAALVAHVPYVGLCGTIKFDADGAVRSIIERLYRYKSGALQELQLNESPIK